MSETWEGVVFEPLIDPGGYEATFRVEATCEDEAHELLLEKAWVEWPDAGLLTTWNVRRLGGE